MSTSIIPQLVKKDYLLSRKMILRFFFFCIASIALVTLLIGQIPNYVLLNIAFFLLIGPAATCGIVLLMKTNVFEKEKATQPFIMSLPVTVREFTIAKLLINVPVFVGLWLFVCAGVLYFIFNMGLLPIGTVPFVTMILLGIFVAYTGILAVSLLFQTLASTVVSIVVFELTTSAYLWIIAYSDAISNHVYGAQMVWNSTAITIVSVQVVVAIGVILTTLMVQSHKRDFI